VTLIQRFGSALNLTVHFHMLFLDGIYTENKYGKTRFQRTEAPDQRELTGLVHIISHRVAGFLEREGILERDEENSYLNLEGEEDPMQQVLGCSVSYRIAIGPQQGRKVFTLQTLPSREDDDRFAQVAKQSGFSLHAGVAAQRWERQKLEIDVSVCPQCGGDASVIASIGELRLFFLYFDGVLFSHYTFLLVPISSAGVQ
jgi:hypothetical protein